MLAQPSEPGVVDRGLTDMLDVLVESDLVLVVEDGFGFPSEVVVVVMVEEIAALDLVVVVVRLEEDHVVDVVLSLLDVVPEVALVDVFVVTVEVLVVALAVVEDVELELEVVL